MANGRCGVARQQQMDAKQVQGPTRDEVYKCLEEYKTNQCDIEVAIY